MSMRFVRHLAVLALSALAACGGGGGGGTPPPTVTLSASSVTLQDIVGAPSYDQQLVTATVTGGTGSYYVRFTVDHPERFLVATATVTGSQTATIGMVATHATPTRATGTGTFDVCADAYCNSILVSRTLSYRIATFELSANVVSTSAYQGADAAPQVLTLAPSDTSGELQVTSTQDDTGGPTWLTTSAAADAITVNTSGVGLQQQAYTGTAHVAIAGKPNIVLNVPVSLTVGSGTVAPAPQAIAATVASTGTTMWRSVPVRFAPGVSPAWTAEGDQPWIKMDHAAGTGDGSFGLTADTTAMASLSNYGTASGHLTIHAQGLDDVVVPVTLDMQMPYVTGVSTPVVGLTGPRTMTVTGRGLAQPTALGGLSVANGTITSRTLVSDTSATITVKALAAGPHAVSVANAAGVATVTTAVWARDPSPPAYAAIADGGEKRAALYDGARGAVFAVGYQNDFLIRYMRVNGTWKVDRLAIPSVNNLAMSFDHRTLYVTSSVHTVYQVDPDSLTVVGTLIAPFEVVEEVSRTTPLVSTADGRVWLNQVGGYYDPGTRTFGEYCCGGFQVHIGAPTDGSRVFFGDKDSSRVYDTSTQAVRDDPVQPRVYTAITQSADSSRRIVDWCSFYDGQWAQIGWLRAIPPGQTQALCSYASVVSPDGQRAYALTSVDPSQFNLYLSVYDTTQYRSGTTDLLETGRITLPDPVNCLDTSAGWCDVLGNLMVDEAGAAVYWIGDAGLDVIPIPATMRATRAGAVLPRLQKALPTR